MSDCPNAEIRDLLPDLLHDRLDAPTRARVLAHVDGCADCRSELELLRSLRGSIERATPRVDLDRIVAALPKPSTVQVRRRRVWSDWRVAAAVTFLVAGGTSALVIRSVRDGARDSSVTAPIPEGPAPIVGTGSDSAAAHRTGTPGATTSVGPSRTPRVTPPSTSTAEAVAPSQAVVPTDDQSLGLGSSRIGDLNERQLKALLTEIDQMKATPVTEPEPVTLRVGTKTTSVGK
jgi:hypothetical protein